MTTYIDEIAPELYRAAQDRGRPGHVLKSIVDGVNTGNLDALMPLYEPEAAFATQPGSLSQFAIPVASDFENVKKAWHAAVTITNALALRGALGGNLSRFLAIRDELGVDPGKMFVNPYLHRVLFA